MNEQELNVLIVDDSVTQREILKRVLEGDPDFAVAGEACNGKEAVAALAPSIPSLSIRQFLVKNLVKGKDGRTWAW